MKTLLNRFTAVISVCAIALCSTAFNVSAEEADDEITITFDYTSDGATIKDDSTLASITTKPNSSIVIPEGSPKRDGYAFSGWTCDDIHAYIYGDVFRSPDGNDVTLKPIWVEENQETKYKVEYVVEIDGELVDTSETLPEREYYSGQIVTVPLMTYSRDDAAQFGWTDGTNTFAGQEKFIVHDHDVTLTPNWHKKYKITYTVGDVDRVTGATFMEYEQPEKIPTGLQADTRFSRNGFKIAGWLCDDDDKVYSTNFPTYIMPSHDVTFTAVWEAKEYNVVFKQDGKSSNNIKIKGKTDTEIITPSATITQDGKYLAGWKDSDGTVYPVGSPYMIKGAIAGAGIVLDAVWEEGTPPETTTTTTQQTTTTQTTTTTVTDTPSDIAYGDADEKDGVNINDAVLIMQSIANPDKYKLSEQGRKNADVVDNGGGITNSDALAIQYIESKTITEQDLPMTTEKLDSLAG